MVRAVLLGLCAAFALAPYPLWPLLPALLGEALRLERRQGAVFFLALYGAWSWPLLRVLLGEAGGLGGLDYLLGLLLYAAPAALAFLLPEPWARAGALGVAEIARSYLGEPLGLHLALLGEGLVETPLRLLAAWVGPHGLSLVALLLSALWAEGRRWALLPLPASLLLIPLLSQAQGNLPAVLVEAGTPLEVKLQGLDLGRVYRDLTPEGPGLVVWPETATALPPSYPLWVGGVETGGSSRGVLVVDGKPAAWRDKALLTPFAEGLPYFRELGGFYRKLGLAPDRLPGEVHPLGSYGVLLCFEATSPRLARKVVLEGARVLLVLTNEGWFDGTPFKAYRLAQDRLRAVETGRWLLRAAETGPTGAVDPLGRVQGLLPEGRGYVRVSYEERSGLTPYTRWGEAPALAGALLLLGLGLRKGGRAKSPPPGRTRSSPRSVRPRAP